MSADGANSARALLVEDNFLISMEFADRVSRLGFVVDGPHASAAQAREASERQLPDVAILDVRVRGGSSVALAEWLVAQDVPVIFLTGYGEIPQLSPSLVGVPTLRKPVADGLLERHLVERLARLATR